MQKRLDNELEVRLLRPEDAEALFNLIDQNREHLRPWFEMVQITQKVSDTAAWIQSMLARRGNSPRGWSGIFERGKLVGAIGVTSLDEEKASVEIGYYLAADACGRGIATRACAAMLDHLFKEIRLHRVELRMAATNQRSIRLAEKLGFTLEGRLREADVFNQARRDLLIYGMLSRDWCATA
jgi:ribosomal-protein-serine acetyltransferase